MPKQGKSPKKKTKEKSPQRTEESEYPEMDQDVYNRLLQNAIEHSKAELQQRHEEQLKAVEERLTRKFDDEVRELSRAFDESRGANPTTRDTTLMRSVMKEAVVNDRAISPPRETSRYQREVATFGGGGVTR